MNFRFLLSKFPLLFWLTLSIFGTASAQTNAVVAPPAPPTNLHVVPDGTVAASPDIPDIPSLNWQPLSDWINVKSNVSPVAIGDGVADDTAALQAALNMVSNTSKTIYLPAGTYRITQTLAMPGPTGGLADGSAIIGNGRDTRLVWGGTNGGVMFQSKGVAYVRYIGLSWEGSNTAAVGFDHASTNVFETEVQHIDESFRNFTNSGIRVGNNQIVASAEILYRNCLFTNCGTAINLLTYNDYDNTIDHCEFENCGTGVYCSHGNFYARNSHFEKSRQYDFWIAAEHGCSIRRCTSVGSKYFVYEQTIAPLTMQDCQVANWTATDADVYLFHGPAMVFDCVFTGAPSNSFPIKVASAAQTGQTVLLSNNRPSPVQSLVTTDDSSNLYIIPNGVKSGVLTYASQRFLQGTEAVPGRIFDAKQDFGATGNGSTDDTAAIQSTINAAMSYGQGAMAYLPTGGYVVKQTLLVTGSNYIMGGSGFQCGLLWRGSTGAPTITVSNVHNVTLANFCAGGPNFRTTTNGDDIWVTSASNQPCQLTIDGVYVYGMYSLNPDVHGIHFDSLPTGSVVVVPKVQGNLRITNCSQATLLFRTSYQGTLTLRGPGSTNNMTGFLMRMATHANPALQVFDNQSVVMSDFYIESCQQVATFVGINGQSAGAVTIQQPKIELLSSYTNIFAINGYTGRIYDGQAIFYDLPTNTVFSSTNTTSLQLMLAGEYWKSSSPVFNLDSNAVLTLMGNAGAADSGITSQAGSNLSLALDDLRRLGELDNRLPQSNP